MSAMGLLRSELGRGSELGWAVPVDRRARDSSTALEPVVIDGGAGLAQARSRLDGLPDLRLSGLDLGRDRGHLGRPPGRYHDDPVAIADEVVTRIDPDPANRHRAADGFDAHAILAGPHPVAPGEDRIGEGLRTAEVTA